MKSFFTTSMLCLALLATNIPQFTFADQFGPTPYLQTSDSPFNSFSFDYFHLENFEGHLFNVPGVVASAGGVTSVIFGAGLHDSVDGDDGVVDGSGLLGDSFLVTVGGSISFTFNSSILGALPTHAGLVWTDGFGTTTFQAFDAGNVLLGTIGPVSIADGSFAGETAEDRFFGFSNSAGISRILISNTNNTMEVDHLQYGFVSIPEPGCGGLLAVGLGLLGAAYRRKQI